MTPEQMKAVKPVVETKPIDIETKPAAKVTDLLPGDVKHFIGGGEVGPRPAGKSKGKKWDAEKKALVDDIA